MHYVGYDPKFIPQQIAFLTSQFPAVDQVFFVQGAPNAYLKVAQQTVRHLGRRTWLEFLRQALSADRVIINGLFDPRIPLLLFPFPWIIRKSIWLPWGGDLYWHRYRRPGLRTDVLMWFRRRFIRKLLGIATMTRGDYELARDYYGTGARYIESGPNVFSFECSDLDRIRAERAPKDYVAIQIGNSGDPTNEHFEALDWLATYRERNIRVYAPLSYGIREYIERVIEYGKNLFGDRFTALTELLPFETYNRYLSSLDVVVLNHRRQQGFGNAAISLYLGSKVYLRKEVTIWNYLSCDIGCRIFDSSEIGKLSFDEFVRISDRDKEHNRQTVAMLFDREWQKRMWGRIYSE